MQMKNNLSHVVNYENTIFWKVRHDVYQLKKPLNIFRPKKAYFFKISESAIYVNESFYVFLYPERYHTSTKKSFN